ncbi:MAG: hypothetical protein IJZ16_12345, partial [Clostridia bacterium]|nr:hypothetical protein [Clostridia bacterium]
TCFNKIYKDDPSSKVFIVNGTDYEKSVFFAEIEKLFHGYNIAVFNPFYDECIDGIFIKNLNTYIISDGGYNKISPILSAQWENQITISQKNFDSKLIHQLIVGKQNENNLYRQACGNLKKAGFVKERIHKEISPHLNEDKILALIMKLCRKFKGKNDNNKSEIKLLSSPTPLGFHTHYDTIFSLCDEFININDDTGFISSIVLGVVKNCAIKKGIQIVGCTQYFNNKIYQFLLFPKLKTGICTTDFCHILPFEASYNVNSTEFIKENKESDKKVKTLLSVEEKFLKKAILSLYAGREERFKYNDLIKGYMEPDKAQECAKQLAERILN